jgi:nucleoside-diphosphate-sugar epimerase
VETPKRVKPWWFVTDAGKLALSVRYGTKVLELAKGKVAVEVGSEKDLVPTSFYGATKLANEVLAKSLTGRCRTRIRGLRFFTVYGSYGREDMAYYKFLNQIVKNKKITIYGKKNFRRSFTSVNDVVICIYKLLLFFKKKKKF